MEEVVINKKRLGPMLSNMKEDLPIEQVMKNIENVEQKHCGLHVMRPFYDSEKNLDRDWRLFQDQNPLDMQNAENIAFKYYGMRNGKVYDELKSWYMQNDIGITDPQAGTRTYIAGSSVNESMEEKRKSHLDDRARSEAMIRNIYIVTGDANDIEDLKNKYSLFMLQTDDDKQKSDQLSIQIYGMTNEENYKQQMAALVGSEDNTDTSPSMYDVKVYYATPNDIGQQDSFSIDTVTESSIAGIGPKIMKQDTITRYESIRDYVRESNDPILSAFLINEAYKESPPTTIVEEIILDSLLEEFSKKNILTEESLFGPSAFLTPEEIDNLGVFTEDSLLGIKYSAPEYGDSYNWYLNYCARSIGLRPVMNNMYVKWNMTVHNLMNRLYSIPDDDKLKEDIRRSILCMGWNPDIPFIEENKEKARTRYDRIIQDTIGYLFVDATKKIAKHILGNTNGIFVFIITTDDDHNKVVVSTSPSIRDGYLFDNGLIKTITDTGSLSSYKDLMDVFMLPIQNTTKEKLDKALDKVNRRFYNYSYMHDLMQKLNVRNLDIANQKLYCVHLMNMLLNLAECNIENEPIPYITPTIANPSGEGKNSIYLIYSGKSNAYKDDLLENESSSINESAISEDLDFLSPFMTVTPLQEFSLSAKLTKEGNIFIGKKNKTSIADEFYKDDKIAEQYYRANSTEMLKFYLAKYWYMNQILVNIIKSGKVKQPELKKVYTLRAHLLSKFSKYFKAVTKEDKKFDFQKYYKSTPFGKDKGIVIPKQVWTSMLKFGIAMLTGKMGLGSSGISDVESIHNMRQSISNKQIPDSRYIVPNTTYSNNPVPPVPVAVKPPSVLTDREKAIMFGKVPVEKKAPKEVMKKVKQVMVKVKK